LRYGPEQFNQRISVPMNPSSNERPKSRLTLKTVLTAVSDMTRWRIFSELQQQGGMTTLALANKLRVPLTNVSKHLTWLRKQGILEQGMGRVYRLADRFLVPGERTVDFGSVVLRLDREPV
jgi:predicted transcriptional regulator